MNLHKVNEETYVNIDTCCQFQIYEKEKGEFWITAYMIDTGDTLVFLEKYSSEENAKYAFNSFFNTNRIPSDEEVTEIKEYFKQRREIAIELQRQQEEEEQREEAERNKSNNFFSWLCSIFKS